MRANEVQTSGDRRDLNAPPISLNGASRVSLVAEGQYEALAKAGMRVQIRSSIDGTSYGTTDVATFENDFRPARLGERRLN